MLVAACFEGFCVEVPGLSGLRSRNSDRPDEVSGSKYFDWSALAGLGLATLAVLLL